MIRLPPRSTRTDTLFPYTSLFRSLPAVRGHGTVRGGLHESFRYPSHDADFTGHCGLRDAAFIGHGPDMAALPAVGRGDRRSEEHTSELQSLMRISYADFCLKKKNTK